MAINDNFSILFGGKAGDGIDTSGLIIARILNQLGRRLYVYRDYPSIIRGGHTFSIIRACRNKIACHENKVDFILALNQETLDLHRAKLKTDCWFVFDADQVKIDPSVMCGIGLPLGKILKEENAPAVMRNSSLIGGFCRAIGVEWDILERVLRKEITREIELNLKVARRGFDAARELIKISPLPQPPLPIVSGNEAIGLGLIIGGLDTYIAYPMTPASTVLHFLAGVASDFSLDVIHPESEISVVLMALGSAYAGKKAAVGTSGGGFCLMTEALSFSGMSELPIVFMLGQRGGPSTGLPTYTAQTELHFALNAGQGEFTRLVVAPGDCEEAYFWSAVVMSLSWQFQIPAIILSDKTLSEGAYSFDIDSVKMPGQAPLLMWDRKPPYKRYLDTETGVSPLAFVPDKEAIIKVNSYEHDEMGITTEDSQKTKAMQEKRLRKEQYLKQELEKYPAVMTYGHAASPTAILCWGSNKGVCVEAAEILGLKVIQPIVLAPFPVEQFKAALSNVKKLICVENNATSQLLKLLTIHGFSADEKILRYDGRPFILDELVEELKKRV